MVVWVASLEPCPPPVGRSRSGSVRRCSFKPKIVQTYSDRGTVLPSYLHFSHTNISRLQSKRYTFNDVPNSHCCTHSQTCLPFARWCSLFPPPHTHTPTSFLLLLFIWLRSRVSLRLEFLLSTHLTLPPL